MSDDQLSPTMREYLAQIYNLSETLADDAFVTTSDLAMALDVSPPAVNRMIAKLRDLNLLDHERYQGIRLTDAGAHEALKQLRRQRIAEAFLTNVMGLEWHEVHTEAERMGSALSDVLVDRMQTMAGNPATSPHGAPIPSPEGTLPAEADVLLVDAEAGQHYRITHVVTREADRLEYLAALHLTPGQRFELLHRAPFNGPLQLKLGNEYRIIGHNLAEVIRVQVAGA